MLNIHRVLIASSLTVGLAVATSAQQHQDHKQQDHKAHHEAMVGKDVTLSACVQRGNNEGTFILTDVADVPVHAPTMGRVVYWLDSLKDVKKHVGSQVRIKGKISEVKQSEIEVRAGDDEKGGWYVEIEGPGRDVVSTAEKAGVSTANRKDDEDDIKTTLVRLKVDDVTKVANACPR